MAARVTGWVLRGLLAFFFLGAGVFKVVDFPQSHFLELPNVFAVHEWKWATPAFYESIEHYELVSSDVAVGMAVYLPWLEIAAALALLTRRARLGGLAVIGTLLLIFLGALASAWWRELDISCGCFGHEVREPLWQPLQRDGVLLAMAGAVWWLEALQPLAPDTASRKVAAAS